MSDGEIRRKLEQAVLDAFADLRRPEADELYGGADHCEADLALDDFGDTRWQELIDVKLLSHHRTCLSFFGPAAFRYYFPAYLRAAIRPQPGPDRSYEEYRPTHDVVFHASPDWRTEGWKANLFAARFDGYSVKQRRVNRDILHYFAEQGNGDARKALRRYWSSV